MKWPYRLAFLSTHRRSSPGKTETKRSTLLRSLIMITLNCKSTVCKPLFTVTGSVADRSHGRPATKICRRCYVSHWYDSVNIDNTTVGLDELIYPPFFVYFESTVNLLPQLVAENKSVTRVTIRPERICKQVIVTSDILRSVLRSISKYPGKKYLVLNESNERK